VVAVWWEREVGKVQITLSRSSSHSSSKGLPVRESLQLQWTDEDESESAGCVRTTTLDVRYAMCGFRDVIMSLEYNLANCGDTMIMNMYMFAVPSHSCPNESVYHFTLLSGAYPVVPDKVKSTL